MRTIQRCLHRFVPLLLFAACICLYPVASWPQTTQPSAAKTALEDVLKAPGDTSKFRKYLTTLPRFNLPQGGMRYVVEGDLLLSEEQVLAHLNRSIARTTTLQTGSRPELIVNDVNGKPDFWASQQDRKLTYAIDRSSFTAEGYVQIKDEFARAAKAWVDACSTCGISFTYRAEFDGKPDPGTVTFIVRAVDDKGQFYAAAFFPSWDKSMFYVNVGYSYFTSTFDRVGILRHELGHVLGYRHEHTRDVAGCFFEDRKWFELTTYDPQSVMHYLCGDAGSRSLQLTELDTSGHQRLYGSNGADLGKSGQGGNTSMGKEAAKAQPVVGLRFEGGDVSENLFASLSILAQSKQLPTEKIVVKRGDNPCSLMKSSLGLPSKIKCTDALVRKLWDALNGQGAVVKPLQIGQEVTVPSGLKAETYNFTQAFDNASRRNLVLKKVYDKNWRPWIVGASQDGKFAKQEIEAYSLDVPVAKEAYLPDSISKLKNLGSQNFYVEVRDWAEHKAARKFAGQENAGAVCRSGTRPPLIPYATMVFAAETADCATTCVEGNCANVFLIDSQVHKHPKLTRAMGFPSASPASAPADCQSVDWDEKYHATHLAGIIAANADGNYGPTGLSPGVKLWPIELRAGTEDSQIADSVQEWMRDRIKYPGPKILAFASEYRTDGPSLSAQFEKEIDRFSASIAAKRISRSDVLLVTAVGQETKGPTPHAKQPINTTSKVFPMNLGDLDNVIVVTACVDCENVRSAIMPDANYSGPGLRVPLVHLAAPGGLPIAGIITSDAKEIARGIGTSQASAFVAGAAAAVSTCFPQYLRTPGDIKKHLMVTSRPSLSADAHALVATGILDYGRALRDPRKDWMQQNGSDELQPIAISGWCSSQVQLFPSNGDPPTSIDTATIRRIFRTTNDSGGTRWIIYGEDLTKYPYGLIKYGPGELRGTQPLARLVEAEQLVSLSRFSDLLIAQRLLGTVDCREKQKINATASKR